jgi:hypothetical protein
MDEPATLSTTSLDTPSELLRAVVKLRDEVVHEGARTFAEWKVSMERRSFAPSALNLGPRSPLS